MNYLSNKKGFLGIDNKFNFNEKVVVVSSKTGENIKELKELIQNTIINQNPYKYKKNEMKGVVDTFGN